MERSQGNHQGVRERKGHTSLRMEGRKESTIGEKERRVTPPSGWRRGGGSITGEEKRRVTPPSE